MDDDMVMNWTMDARDYEGKPFQTVVVTVYEDKKYVFLGLEDPGSLLLKPDEALKLIRKLLEAYSLVAQSG